MNNEVSAGSDRLTAIDEVVHGLSVSYNACLSYGPDHPVLRRTILSQMRLLEPLLAAEGGLTLLFHNDQVWSGALPVDSGNPVCRRLAQLFQGRNVGGITLEAGLTEEELATFLDIIARQGDQLKLEGLQPLLDEAGIIGIVERKEKLVLSQEEPLAAPAPRHEAPPSPPLPPRPAAAGVSVEEWAKAMVGQPPQAAPQPVDLGGILDEGLPADVRPPIGEDQPIGDYVNLLMADVLLKRTMPVSASKAIGKVFERRLEAKVREFRIEMERRVNILEQVRDMMLEELDGKSLAALLLDREFHVLAMNRTAQALLGKLERIAASSPLHPFLDAHSRCERLTFPDGVERTVYRVLSADSDRHDLVILVCIE
ncbi:MAG: hypothetical protein WC789_10080 [Lentisphaeria bacterium]